MFRALALAAVLNVGCVALVVTGHCDVHAVVVSEAEVTCVANGASRVVRAEGGHVSDAFMAPFTTLAEAASGLLRWFMPRASTPPQIPDEVFTRA